MVARIAALRNVLTKLPRHALDWVPVSERQGFHTRMIAVGVMAGEKAWLGGWHRVAARLDCDRRFPLSLVYSALQDLEPR